MAGLIQRRALDAKHHILQGMLPAELIPDPAMFESLWALHPEDYHEIKMLGRAVRTPRWQQAYGADYVYTGNTNRAERTPEQLEMFLSWVQSEVHLQINGLLVNWYDGKLGHYIGRHRDSAVNMVSGSPIVTISLGEERVFRLRRYRGNGFQDFPVVHGSVFIIPFETNRYYTHEVPHFARFVGRRISVTLRAFRGKTRCAE